MENFVEIKENIVKQAIANDACEDQVKRAKYSQNWEQLQQVIADNFWWCIDNDIELPDAHYKNNEREFTIVNGKVNGEYKIWCDNGQLGGQYFYKDGLLNGEYKQWYKNGQPFIHCTYKDGERDGEYKMWYNNGQLREHCFHKNGWLDGESKEWYENGQLRVSHFHKDGEVLEW
jgi:antitoxin component YwqK of YwqJK toxin-antitoxin module